MGDDAVKDSIRNHGEIRRLGEYLTEWKRTGGAAPRSRNKLLLKLVDAEMDLWRHAPYKAHKAMHFVFVSRNGDLTYWREEALELTSPVQLRSDVEMKHTKIRAYLSEYAAMQQKPDVAEYLRSRWATNRFALFESESETSRLGTWGREIEVLEDTQGITSKYVTFSPHGYNWIHRTQLVVLKDYVQWGHGGDPAAEEDGAQFDITIPTRDLDCIVVVDEDLYRSTPESVGRKLRYRPQNREAAAAADIPPGSVFMAGFDKISSYSTKPLPDKKHEAAVTQIGDVFDRVNEFSLRYGIDETSLPNEYMFYRVSGSRPHPSVRIMVKWPRPERWREPLP